jgi:hypothetical protein
MHVKEIYVIDKNTSLKLPVGASPLYIEIGDISS